MSDKFDGNTSLMAYRSNNTRSDLRQDAYGNAIVSGGLPRYADLATARKIYVASSGTHAGIAPAAAVPTTAAQWALQNNNTGNTCLVIMNVSAYSVSGTLGLGMALAITNDTTVQAAYANVALSTVIGTTPGHGASLANIGVSKTLVGYSWEVVAARDQVSAVSVGSGLSADIGGAYIVPPGGYLLGLAVVAPLGSTAKFGVTVRFAEIDLNLA